VTRIEPKYRKVIRKVMVSEDDLLILSENICLIPPDLVI
jgi:hypothetical protein